MEMLELVKPTFHFPRNSALKNVDCPQITTLCTLNSRSAVYIARSENSEESTYLITSILLRGER